MDSKVNVKLYKRIEIWKRISNNKAARYICYKILNKKEFCVQNVDFFYTPISSPQIEQSDQRSFELFLEMPPDKRAEQVFPTLFDAIQAHDEDFG